MYTSFRNVYVIFQSVNNMESSEESIIDETLETVAVSEPACDFKDSIKDEPETENAIKYKDFKDKVDDVTKEMDHEKNEIRCVLLI